MTNIDWQTYKDTFPIRYLEKSYFDELLIQQIKNNNPLSILDIGGNTGTETIKEFNILVDLLDPFVSKPEWIHQQISWQSPKTYDLVFARNCINYLTIEELKIIPKFLNKNAVFIVNTFTTPPSANWTEREYQTQSGLKGTERFRLKDNKIEHILIYQDIQIEHSFFYYSLNDWKEYFPKAQFLEHKKNSLIILWKK